MSTWISRFSRATAVALALALTPASLYAQPGAALRGRVVDPLGAVVAGAAIRVRNDAGVERSTTTEGDGRYRMTAIPPGRYLITASAEGFRSTVVESVVLEPGGTRVWDVHLAIGPGHESVVVSSDAAALDRATTMTGHRIAEDTVRNTPLNGRHFVDLGLLVPGSVAPSQTGFSTTPARGMGALALNTAGHREEAVGFFVNGVATNNLTYGSLGFQPPLDSIQELRVDNSVFSAEYGHVSGAIVHVVTRSGTDRFRGELFEFFRHQAFDARNFFERTAEPHPFNRHQFGGTFGGPLLRDRTFFFATYEGLRQRQGLDMNSLVLSDEQRARATDPVARELLAFIPHANVVDANGTPRFVGSADAVVEADRATFDIQHTLGGSHRLHVFYGGQWVESLEPASGGTTVPGFGHRFHARRDVLVVNTMHVLGPSLLNEARIGRSRLAGAASPATALNPSALGIRNGVSHVVGLPQIVVAGGLSFGGPALQPVGRDDVSYVVADTVRRVSGRHAIGLGGEYRHFSNANVSEGTGLFTVPSVDAFLSGTANAFSITLGERRDHIDQRAAALFVQDSLSLGQTLTLDVGLRYEWHVTPTERDDRFVVFDAASASLRRVGVDVARIYRQNNRNLEPRVGVAWSPSRDGRFVVRAAYGHGADEPGTTAVKDTTANPPFAMPRAASGAIPFSEAIDATSTVLLAPVTVDPGFRNASLRSWNVNVQSQLASGLETMAGYFGSRGRHLRLTRNINQPIDGVRPFPALSPSSPILPGEPLGNILQVESTGWSRYDALWATSSARVARRVQTDVSYTLSTSLDTNSLNSSGFAVQDSYDIGGQYGWSDFHARHRFLLRAVYDSSLARHRLARDWRVAVVFQAQSGNPVNIVTATSTLTGTPNSVRPDVTGPVRILGSVDQWFEPSVFVAVDRFGTLRRNAVIGPGFRNTDLSVARTLRPADGAALELRLDVFDLFNQPNFGPPGHVVGSPTFGVITRTRLPTGEAGSSRQMQLAARVSF